MYLSSNTVIASMAAESAFKDQYLPGGGQTKKFDLLIILSALSDKFPDGIAGGLLVKIVANGKRGGETVGVHKALKCLMDTKLVEKKFNKRVFNKIEYKYFLTDSGIQLVNLYQLSVNDIKRKLRRGEKI